MRLNAKKTHEMVISFKKSPPNLDPIVIDNQPIEIVESAKLVGVTLQSNLKWDIHTDNIFGKTEKRIYFLKRLKQAKATTEDLMKF